MKAAQERSPLIYLLRISSGGGWFLALTVALSVISGILTVLPFYGVYRLIEELMSGTTADAELVGWGVFILVTGVAYLVIMGCSIIASHVTAYRVLRDIRYSLARKLLEMPLGWFTKRTSGDTRKLFAEDTEKIELFIAHHIPDLIAGVVTPITTLVFLITVDWRLALVSLVPAVIAPFFLVKLYSNYDKDMSDYYSLLGRMNGTIIEYIRGMTVVRAFNRTAESFGDYRESVDQYFRFWKGWTVNSMRYYGGFLTIIESGVLFILVVGGPLYLADMVSLPAFFIALILGPAYVASLKQLMFFSNLMSANLQGVKRLQVVLEADPLLEPSSPLLPEGDDVVFDGVSFAYENDMVLRDVCLKAEPGALTAFVGPSGAGKSTAAMLAARFYDPASGAVCIGGRDYRDVGTKEIMKRASMCFQEAHLFKGTIEENIRMGNRAAPFEKVVAAAEAARADEFISLLPQGYKTPISGDRTLSGGQIQRIAISRAILKDSPVLILDEATSYADPENERLIQEALNELLSERTVIVVAHRIKTLRNVDQICVFEEGRIVEAGTWSELVFKEGTFARLLQAAEAAREWHVTTGPCKDESEAIPNAN